MQELDSIIARALRVAEFFDSIDPKRTFGEQVEKAKSRGVRASLCPRKRLPVPFFMLITSHPSFFDSSYKSCVKLLVSAGSP
jgi:hypothetical protein